MILIQHKNSLHIQKRIKTEDTKPVIMDKSLELILEPLTEGINTSLKKRSKRGLKLRQFKDDVKCLTDIEMRENLNDIKDIIESIDDIKFKGRFAQKSAQQLLETPQIDLKTNIIENYFKKRLKTRKMFE